MMRNGTVAVFGMRPWTMAKAAKSAPNNANIRIIGHEDHSKRLPPHCKARRRETTLGTRKRVPSGSSRRICCLIGTGFFGRLGSLRRNMTTPTESAPIGRLIQKHHLQLSFPVNKPPSRGPATDDTPNIMPNMAKITSAKIPSARKRKNGTYTEIAASLGAGP